LKDLTTEQINLLLYGDQSISSSLELDMNDENIPNEYTGSYEGIIPMLKRWFTSTQSNEGLKSWVEKFMELSTCTTCNGQD
jgi:excinuclease ABC subunit A